MAATVNKPSEPFKQSDVTFWGLAALVCAALAVLSVNLSAVLPESLMSGLHAPRVAGASLGGLRTQVRALQEEQVRLRRENAELTARFALSEKNSGQIVRRVGALEVSVPSLLEALPPGAEIDRSAITASIDAEGAPQVEVEGGSISIAVQPLPEARANDVAVAQPMPKVLADEPSEAEADGPIFAVALGLAVAPEDARPAWEGLLAKVGPLLVGLEPRLGGEDDADERTLIAGPIEELRDASVLCERLSRVNVACLPVPYTGSELP